MSDIREIKCYNCGKITAIEFDALLVSRQLAYLQEAIYLENQRILDSGKPGKISDEFIKDAAIKSLKIGVDKL